MTDQTVGLSKFLSLLAPDRFFINQATNYTADISDNHLSLSRASVISLLQHFVPEIGSYWDIKYGSVLMVGDNSMLGEGWCWDGGSAKGEDNLGDGGFGVFMCGKRLKVYICLSSRMMKKTRAQYQKIDEDKRMEIIERILKNGEQLKTVSDETGVNISTCKAIIKVYQDEGRVGKKQRRNKMI